jgi:hypothetical protein
VTQCTDCDGGKHCSVEGSTAVTGDCDAGYYCQSGVDRPNPDNSATNSTYPPIVIEYYNFLVPSLFKIHLFCSKDIQTNQY